MELLTLSVFVQGNPFRGGNPLAVFPDAGSLSGDEMQAIARTMNLSESTFVTLAEGDSYKVRIFTPHEELPFAGHPTLGTAWVLRELGRVSGSVVQQHSGAGVTEVSVTQGLVWFRRTGTASPDLEERNVASVAEVATMLRVDERDVGVEAREFGRPGFLRPAFAEAGLEQLMIPLRDLAALGRCRPDPALLKALTPTGAYCFTGTGAGKVRTRGFFAPLGIVEDPATGSAAAALGIYLGARLEAIELEVIQGVEMGSPSTIHLKASAGEVRIGGRCALLYRGTLAGLP
jgi:trans-2,3-dihydro-3-hydroxyanthranilate isomerase